MDAAVDQQAPMIARVPASIVVARNASWLLAGQAAVTGLSVILSAALGRYLGAGEYGLFFVITSMTVFAFSPVEWGQPQQLTRDVARQPERAGDLLGGALAFRVAAAGAMCLVSSAAVWVLGYDARTRLLFAMLMLAMIPFSCVQAFGVVYRGLERMGCDAIVATAAKAFTVALSILALALGGRIAMVIAAQAAAGMLALALTARVYRRNGLPAIRVGSRVAREIAVRGTPFMAITLLVCLQICIDAVVLSKLAHPDTVGWYGAARTFLNAVVMPASMLATAVYPRLSRAANDPSEFRRDLRQSMRLLIVFATLTGVGTYVFADVAVALVYGAERFGPAASVLRVFAPILLLLSVEMLLSSAALALGKPLQVAKAKLVAIGIGTAVELWLVPVFELRSGNGGIGIVLAYGIGELTMLAACAFFLLPRRVLALSTITDLARAFAAAAITLLLFESLRPMHAYLCIPLCVGSFAFLAAAFRLVRRDDLASAALLLRRRA